jgi:DNA-binding NtrC family response regulator
MCIHVLLMEDNPNLAKQMAKALLAAGHDCRAVNGIEPALREIDRRMPQVVVADFQVTDGTAADLLAGLRAKAWEQLPVLIATAVGPLARETAACYPQVKGVLDKPVQAEQLVREIERIADRSLRNAGSRRLIGPDERRRILQLAWADALPEPALAIAGGTA